MRILQVVHRFPPAVKGGVMNYTFELSRELAKSHQVHLLFTRKDLAAAQYTAAEGEYRGLPFTEIIHNGLIDSFEQTYRDPVVDAIFGDLLDRLAPDVVHVQHLLFLSANLVRLAKRRGIPVLFTLHDFWLMCPREIRMKPDQSLCFEVREGECNRCIQSPPMTTSRLDRLRHRALGQLGARLGPGVIDGLRRVHAWLRASLPAAIPPLARASLRTGSAGGRPLQPAASNPIAERNAFLKEICNDVDLFVSPSRFLREEFIRFGLPAERIVCSHHGHDISWVTRRGPRKQKLRFGYVGMLARHKGCDVLIDAFNQLDPDEAQLDVFGCANVNLSFARRLERSATNPSIRFRGGFDRDELARVFGEIDVLVMPSLCFENAPLTICEAFLAGIPVVASRLGGMAELVEDGRNGLLCTPGDAADLKQKIRRLIEQPGLVDDLARGMAPVKTIEQDARDFCDRVTAL